MVCCSRRQVLLLLTLAVVLLTSEAARVRKRKKRVNPLIIILYENVDYTDVEFITKIYSDKAKEMKVFYSLTGPGADRYPSNLFVVNHETGFVRVTAHSFDRERYPSYNLKGVVQYMDGRKAEEDIPLTVIIMDENDNPPTFELHTGNISKMSEKGTLVMTVQGKDDDQAGTINVELHYTILSQEPETDPQMFTLDAKTGELHVRESDALDRETHYFYKLVVEVKDMEGGVGALSGSGTVEIKILDDNPPVLDQTAH